MVRPERSSGGKMQIDSQGINGDTADPNMLQVYIGAGASANLGNCDVRDVANNKAFYGSIYDYNVDTLGGYGPVTISSGFRVRGSIMAWDLTHVAGTLDAAPVSAQPVGNSDAAKFVLYYKTDAWWFESNRTDTTAPIYPSGRW